MANRYAVGAEGGDINSTSFWSTSSGGSSGASVPSTSDVAIFDANSNGGVLSANWTVQDINISAYPNGKQISMGAYNITCTRHFTGNASATAPITGSTGIFTLGASSTAANWVMSATIFDCYFIAAGTGAKTMSGGYTTNKTHTWSQVCNLTNAGGGTVTVKDGWTGTNYFNDAATNPTVEILGGTVTGTLPNSAVGCILKPSVSNIILDGSDPTTYKTLVRESTYLQVVPSTYNIVTTDNVTYFVSFSGKLKTAGMEWNWMHHTGGTHTLEDNVYCKNFFINNGTVTVNGDYTVYIKNGFIHRSTSGVAGTATFEITDTADVFSNTSYSGPGIEGNFTFFAKLRINAPTKTVTLYSGYSASSQMIFGGGGSFTYVDGTIAGATLNPYISGTFTFDLGDWTFGDVTFTGDADVLNVRSNLTIGKNNMYAGSSLRPTSGKTFTITDELNSSANKEHPNTVLGNHFAADIKSTYPLYVLGKCAVADPIIQATGKALTFKSGATSTMPPVNLGGDFTIAFRLRGTVSSTAVTTILYKDANTRVYIAYAASKNLVIYGGPTNWASSPTTTWTEGSYIITKSSADVAPKLYKNNVEVSGSWSNSGGASIVLDGLNSVGVGNNVDITLDELVLFNEVKDATWRESYHAGTAQTSSEAGLVAGWHFDETDVLADIDYQGDVDGITLSKTSLENIRATGMRLLTWHGKVDNCKNVYYVDEDNLKTMAYASA